MESSNSNYDDGECMEEEMDEIDRTKQIWREDEEACRQRLINFKIQQAQKSERKYRSTIDTLNDQLDKLNSDFAIVEQENIRLDSEKPQRYDTFDAINPHMKFFDQLRCIESRIELFKGQLEGMKAINKNLTSQIKSTQAQNDKLEATTSKLKQEEIDSKFKLENAKSEFAALQEKIAQKNQEYEDVHQACLQIKSQIHKQAAEIHNKLDSTMPDLNKQYMDLQNELRVKKETLQNLQKQEISMRSASEAAKSTQKRRANIDMSPQKWISERTTLVNKVRKARQELAGLSNRGRSTTRASQRIESSDISEEEIKCAILNEIEQVKKPQSRGVRSALAAEQNYRASLETELEDLNRTIQEFEEFRDMTTSIMESQIAQAEDTVYLELLKKDLASTRKSL